MFLILHQLRWTIQKNLFPSFCQSMQSESYCLLQLFFFCCWTLVTFRYQLRQYWVLSHMGQNWKSFQTNCNLLYYFIQMVPLLLQCFLVSYTCCGGKISHKQNSTSCQLCTSSFEGSSKHFPVTQVAQVS